MKNIAVVISIVFSLFALSSCDINNNGGNKSTMYTVTYNSNGGSQITSIEVGLDSTFTEPEIPEKDGYSFLGWYSDSSFNNAYNFTSPVIGDVVLTAKWDINQYSISFYDNIGSINESIIQDFDTIVVMPENPIGEGYSFEGWYLDEELTISYNFTTMPSKNIVLYAGWIPKEYIITFEENGGSNVSNIKEHYTYQVNEPLSPVKEGYNFDGWYLDEELTTSYNFTTMPSEDTTLYAGWANGLYTISFEENGGSNVSNITQDYNTTTLKPLNPTKEGYDFGGWYLDEELTASYNFTTMPSEDTTVYARWAATTVYVRLSETGSIYTTPITVDTTQLNWERDSFWLYPDSNSQFNFTPSISGNITLSVILSGPGSIKVSLGGTTHSVYSSGSMSFYVREDETYIINVSNGGSVSTKVTLSIPSISYTTGGEVVDTTIVESIIFGDEFVLSIPEKEGYTFSGWYDAINGLGTQYTNENGDGVRIWDKSSDTTLSPKWTVNQYDILFDSNGGSNVPTITDDFLANIMIPSDLIKENYTFVGWYLDYEMTNEFTSNIMPSENITLYAKWEPFNYNIMYQFSDNSNTQNPDTYNIETQTFSLFDISKEGYTFIGWYDNDEFNGSKITEIELGTSGDLTFYAKWSVNSYEISYYIFDDFNPLSYIILYPGEMIVSSSLGSSHSAVLTSNGRILVWGDNSYGQLGNGLTTDNITPVDISNNFNLIEGEVIVSINLGGLHSSALTSLGRVFTWGYNAYGQLGNGSTNNGSAPGDITSHFNLVEGETIVSVELGSSHSSAITSSGRMFTWGSNSYGELGNDGRLFRSNPTDITDNFDLSIGEKIVNISLGYDYSAAITSLGSVFAWGVNDHGQLGDDSITSKSIPIDITENFNLEIGETIININLGSYHSQALSSEGRLFTWGSTTITIFNGEIGNILIPQDFTRYFYLEEGETIVSIALGNYKSNSDYFSVITSTGRVFMWGVNSKGQLGDGTTISKSTPIEITNGFSLSIDETIVSINLGGYHSSAITSSGRIFVWGSNSKGQLGNGTLLNKNTPTELVDQYLILVYTEVNDFGVSIEKYTTTLDGDYYFVWHSNDYLSTVYSHNIMPANDFSLFAVPVLEIDDDLLNSYVEADFYSYLSPIYSNDYEFHDVHSDEYPIDFYAPLFDWTYNDVINYYDFLHDNYTWHTDFGYLIGDNYVYFYFDDTSYAKTTYILVIYSIA